LVTIRVKSNKNNFDYDGPTTVIKKIVLYRMRWRVKGRNYLKRWECCDNPNLYQ